MPLFGRRKQAAPEGPPDETFGFFTVEQAARFRDLARQGFAEAGLEVTVYADHVVDDAGRQFGLANVAAVCHNAPKGEREWRAITATHAAQIVRGMDAPSPFETMSRRTACWWRCPTDTSRRSTRSVTSRWCRL
jgi:hypothetical protein